MMFRVLSMVMLVSFVDARRCCPTRRGPIITVTPTDPSCNGVVFNISGISTEFGEAINTGDSSPIDCDSGSLIFKYTCQDDGFEASVDCMTSPDKRELVERSLRQLVPRGVTGCFGDPIPEIANSELEFENPTPLGQQNEVNCESGSELKVLLKCEAEGFVLEPSCIPVER